MKPSVTFYNLYGGSSLKDGKFFSDEVSSLKDIIISNMSQGSPQHSFFGLPHPAGYLPSHRSLGSVIGERSRYACPFVASTRELI